MLKLYFEDWKAEYKPRLYIETGDLCEDESHKDACDCEFLYTVTLEDLADDEDDCNADAENRLWTWTNDGLIVSGIVDLPGADLLITEKPWTRDTLVFD
jgi:hypothetical protein